MCPLAAVRRAGLAQAIEEFASAKHPSSAHALYLDEADREAFEEAGWLLRRTTISLQLDQPGIQWTSSSAFATFTAEQRKKARRERRRVVEEAGTSAWRLRFGTADIGESLLEQVDAFHRQALLAPPP